MDKQIDEATNSTTEQTQGVTRRGFMIGSVGASVAMAMVPAVLLGGCAEEILNTQPFEPTVWYSIDPSGAISVKVTKAEMGQHVGTSLARIVAEELEADWSAVSIDYVDTDAKYGAYVTGGSWSIWTSFDQLSRAGAAGRVALIEEGARLLGVESGQCVAENSQVVCGNKQISYADIVAKGQLSRTYTDEQLASLPLKAAKDRKLVGVDTLALDVPAKSQGTAIYGIDATYEGMVYAKPLLPPTRYGSSVQSVDDSRAKSVQGYQTELGA